MITMKIEEFDSLVKDGNLDTESIIKVRDAIAESNTLISKYENDLTESQKRIAELQETNGKLYLRVTTGSDTVTSKEEVTVEDITKNWGGI